jgi:hypothetical protein
MTRKARKAEREKKAKEDGPSPIRPLATAKADAAKIEQLWGVPVNANGCTTCLSVARRAAETGRTGYISDEELIAISGGTLQHV